MQDIFIKRLMELMEEKNLTQVALAEKIGTTNVTISRYVSGERMPRLEIIGKMAEVLNTSVDYLVGLSNQKYATSNTASIGSLVNKDVIEIHQKLDSLGVLDSKKKLSASQIKLIENLLEANKDFIANLKDSDNAI